ncbi:MAG: hypothetical protein IPL46_30400 [Saprospiraceae bacterium]|nr:hypothetical protein [Saprospiraceae bacterium]
MNKASFSLLAFLLTGHLVTAQVDIPNLPPDSLLFASLDSFYRQKEAAGLLPHSITKKWEWLSYMPSAGITYALSPTASGSFRSRPVPVISLNANAIGSVIHRNKLRKAQIEHLSATLALEQRQDQIDLHKRLDQFKHDLLALSLYQQVYQIQNKIDTIKKAQLDSLLIKPSDYLATQEAHLKQQIQYQDKVATLRDLYWQILAIAHYPQIPSP